MICLDIFLKRLSHTHLHEFNLASMQNISGWFSEVSCVNSPEQTIVDKGLIGETGTQGKNNDAFDFMNHAL